LANFDLSTPFILIARIKVKEGKENDYLQLAKNTDEAVRESEPGMIHHTFDADPENPLCFVWSELYQNDAAFFAHLNNPPVAEYLTQHAELADSFSVEVYGTVGKECREAMISTGLPIKIYETKCGYSRL
jgi:quinol monooxygenase YgiN